MTDASSRQDQFEIDDESFPSDERDDSLSPQNGRQNGDKFRSRDTENRTICLKNLPERAVHRDIVAAVRGGALVDIFLRSRERVASVSFADAKAAQEFMAYAKREHVYVLGKLVSFFSFFFFVIC